MIVSDLEDFGRVDLTHRLLRGGLPPFFLAEELPERDFQEWMDDYWAKDVQELFQLEKKSSFQKLVELLMKQSGGIFEATAFSRPCEISRTTVSNYLSVLEDTFVVNVIRPFSSRRSSEIIAAPKVYGMDSGFVAYHRGWYQLRSEDLGYLWEHLVLNEMHGGLQTRQINFWRDKFGHEIDFVLSKRGQDAIAIECKWSAENYEPGNLKIFRNKYEGGDNFVVCADVRGSYSRNFGSLKVTFIGLASLASALAYRSQ